MMKTPAVKDVVFKKSFLRLAEQREIYERVLRIEPGFYVPVLRTGAKMSLRMIPSYHRSGTGW